MDYEMLDRILWGLDQDWAPDRIVGTMGVSMEQVEHVQEMRRRSEHLRTLPPVPDLV
jgi:hypothetical protein